MTSAAIGQAVRLRTATAGWLSGNIKRLWDELISLRDPSAPKYRAMAIVQWSKESARRDGCTIHETALSRLEAAPKGGAA